MPQILAIPAALFGATTGSIATGAGAGVGLSAFSSLTGKLVSSLVLGGLSVGLSLLLRPPVPEPQSGTIETQQAVPPRTFVYGRLEIAGSVAFKEKPVGTNILYKIVLMHDGEVDAWETIFLDDRICLLDPVTGMVTNAFIQDGENRVWLWLHNGENDQAADAEMLAQFPDVWTVDHKLSGIAYVVCHFHGTGPENFMGAYPNGEPTFKAVIRGRRVYDPRDPAQSSSDPTTFIWSDNPALCILDWISIHPKGYRIDIDKLDLLSFIVMANRCDELVPLTSGVSEKRYRVATQVSLKEPRTNVLARLREACDAHLYLTGEGKWALRGGEWTAPEVTLDVGLGHILDLEMRDGMDALTRYNELSLRYLSPDHQYGEAECDPWQGTADSEFLAGKVKTRQLDLLQVPSYTQARRLAKLMMAFDNPTFVGRATTNFYGLDAVGERNVTLNWSEPGEAIDGPFWIEPDLELGADGATVSMSLRAADPTAYDWDPETEEGEAVPLLPPVDLEFEEGVPPANPTDFAVEGGVRQVVASWTPPADDAFYIARLWRGASGAAFSTAVEVSGPRYRPSHWPDPSMELMTHTDPVRAGTYRYWLTVENPVGDRNTPVGPITVTVTNVIGAAALLEDESNGFAADFRSAFPAKRVAKKVADVVTEYALDDWFSNGGTSPKQVMDNTGALIWAPHNMLLRSENFAVSWVVSGTPIVTTHTIQDDDPAVAEMIQQTLTTVSGETYTATAWILKDAVTSRFPSVGIFGTAQRNVHINTSTGATANETSTLSGSSTVVDAGTHWQMSITFVADGVAMAFRLHPSRGTVLGTANAAAVGTVTIDKTQVNRGAIPTAYLTTVAAARYGLALDYDPTTHAARGLLVEPAATNLLLNNATLSTQSATVTAVAHTLSFWGTGTITLSGVSTAGPLVGTGASNRVSLTFTPTAGSLTLTVSGTVTRAQLEIGSVATSPINTFATTQTRAADNVTMLLSTIPSLGSTYSIYARFTTPTVNSTRYAVALTNGTTSEIAGIQALTGATLSVVDGGVSQAAITIGTLTANTAVSAAMSVQANDVGGSVDESAVTSDVTVTLPTLTEVRFGGVGSNAATTASFRIEKLAIVPRAWSDAELTAKSAA